MELGFSKKSGLVPSVTRKVRMNRNFGSGTCEWEGNREGKGFEKGKSDSL